MDMCAIAGMIALAVPPGTVERMKKTMAHRGPDGFGQYAQGDATLLHARLSVIDPLGGAQPMGLSFGQERYTLVYNGELYNTQELRRELLALGHRFQGHSDTEVVLHSCAQWGMDCLEKFNGIFAFALWEEGKKRLFLARDRIGVKPLFYSLYQGGLLFASELKTILAYPGFQAAVGEEGVAEILLLGPGRTPGCGVFRGTQELEPGCWAMWEGGRLTTRRYWRLTDGEHKLGFEETVECVRALMKDAIGRQLVSDVPIGCFLSGGLDSSLICAVAAGKMARKGETLQTFSVDYRDNQRYFVPGKFQPNSDSDYLGIMEEFLSCNPHRVVLTPEELLGAMEEATLARDLPGMADVDFSLLLLCRQIRKEVTVALSGECADEIFGGYPWYRDPEVRQREGFPWAQSSTQRGALLRPGLAEKLHPQEYLMSRYRQTLEESDILPGQPAEEIRMKQMVNLNFRWFMQTLLDRKDRMSMASSLEVRVPFCDWRIAEFMYRVPWSMKDHGGYEKGLLRRAGEGLLPREILWRKKSPYPKTHDPAYLQGVMSRMKGLLQQKNAPLWALVAPWEVEKLMEGEMSWPWYGQLMAKPQTLAYLLQVDFWLRAYQVDLKI